jgi:hypothetical protein
MIVVYPMIVSNAVSENTLPALSKMLEQYILIYMHDDLINFLNKHGNLTTTNMKLRYKIKGKKIVGESIDLNEVEDWEDPGTGKGGMSSAEQRKKAEIEAYDEEREKEKDRLRHDLDMQKLKSRSDAEKREVDKHKDEQAKGAKVDVKVGSDKTITLEPTWMTVNTEKYGTQMLGIKVVPYRVNSDAKLSHLLMHDIKINMIHALTLRLGRIIMGKLLRLVYRGPVSGDPKKDIIYRTTGHGGETFVVLERNHDIDEFFLKNIKKINRLFKLGWGNFVIADDALQVANFCMRASKGICQGISYRMMYKTLGQSGVYEDLEDIRQQSSSLFKMKRVRFSKLLGESNAENRLINYQERQ